MVKLIVGSLIGAGTAMLVCAAGLWAEEPDVVDSLFQAEVKLLIGQLGHGEFARREAATNRLLKMGSPALGQLERGQQHVDREVRYRCERIVARVNVEQRRRRLAAFLVYQDSAREDELPGWPRFRQLVGDKAVTREMFAKMLSSEWDLLARLDGPPVDVADAFVDRCTEIEQARSLYRQTPTLACIASLLLIAGDEAISVPDQMGAKLHFLCNQVHSFRNALEYGGKNSEATRRLVGAWIRSARGTMTGYYCLNLAMRFDLGDGVGLAEKILARDNAQVQNKEYAILTIAKLGEAKHISVLKPHLNDQSVCRSQTKPKNTLTQIRDVALAATIYLSGENPKEFGFERMQSNRYFVFVTNTIGFGSEEQRQQSLRMWQDFRRQNEKAKS